MEEKAYRHALDETYRLIEDALDPIDPDVVEAVRQGSVLTLAFANGTRAILSPQPPVQQLWLAARAEAFHFGYAEARRQWVDKAGNELGQVLAAIIEREAGLRLRL